MSDTDFKVENYLTCALKIQWVDCHELYNLRWVFAERFSVWKYIIQFEVRSRLITSDIITLLMALIRRFRAMIELLLFIGALSETLNVIVYLKWLDICCIGCKVKSFLIRFIERICIFLCWVYSIHKMEFSCGKCHSMYPYRVCSNVI